MVHLLDSLVPEQVYADSGTSAAIIADLHSNNADTTTAASTPDISGSSGMTQIGTVSPKVYLKHPAGVPKYVLDESPEGSSGAVTSGNILGLSGFIDGQISPVEDPDWSYSVWIEHGAENNLLVSYGKR